ncbi:Patatin-like phospholipase [Variovorax sp. YR266]|uniref:patatin-like phospholipase family protein n=1 Tax=Variovorax sp. YR266 TaxID=1884386 RepID=UPI000895CD85|nr:patatin-like phospholipase family protein [Variovorax sp. YR266]SDZ59954.1 Patatin-like phospholipase [Variovorax sp. YR266]
MSAIDEEVTRRRDALGDPALTGSTRKWGLALSGGGIRSATFCLGVFSALARRGALLRFDLMSSVSGGGYAASMLGRLFSRARNRADLDRIQDEVGKAGSSWFIWWLRANGRYLIPRGPLDRTFAVALYLRNLLGVHVELGLVSVLAGLALAALNLVAWWGMAEVGYLPGIAGYFQWLAEWLPSWTPVVWLALPVVGVFVLVHASAYWAVPWVEATRQQGGVWRICLAVLVASALLLGLGLTFGDVRSETGDDLRNFLWSGFGVLIAVWFFAVRLADGVLTESEDRDTHQPQSDKARNLLTNKLAFSFRVLIVVLAIGLADRLAWHVAFQQIGLASAGIYLAMAAAVLRAVLPLASNLVPGRSTSKALMAIAHLLGYLLAFLLFAWWVSLVYKAVLGGLFVPRQDLAFSDAWRIWGLLLVPVVSYLWCTGKTPAFLNLSSLHAFYRARLIRSYLGAANAQRFGQPSAQGAYGVLGALDSVPAVFPPNLDTASVNTIVADDDADLAHYKPQAPGGPVHLLNVCLNQTKDPRGQLFNQDRRGLSLTVASGGFMRVGQEEWKELKGSDTPMTLGSWMAVSGAAVAPGLGKLTRGGVAALLVFAGVRLGYWWRQPEKDKKHWSDFLTKSWGLMRETLAIFEGKEGRDWFMTDGGHFENTGAYALLSERAEVIVVVDCGADPDYTFGDVENLVRKARIDLQADIEFLRPRRALPGEVPRGLASEPSGFYGALHAFGSLQELASNASNACLAVARINYSDRDGVVEVGPKLKRERGILLIVKPNMCKGLPIDLQNFKRAAPTFPQETTADQFFSEAQWESYFRLGQVLAQDLSPAFIEALRADCVKNEPAHFVPDDCSVALSGAALNGDEKAARGRIIGSVGATAVGASIGLGAAATLGVSAWQAIDSVKVGSASRVDRERKALDELSDLWSKLPAALPANARPTQVAPQLEALASELLKTADTLCPAGEVDWFKRSELARRIYADTLSECRKVVPYVFSRACKGLVEAEHPEAQSRLAVCLKQEPGKTSKEPLPRYWGYDYSAVAPLDGMHLCSPFRAELLKARNRYLADYGEADDQSASLSGKDAGAPESNDLGARRACPKVEATPAGAPPPAVSPAAIPPAPAASSPASAASSPSVAPPAPVAPAATPRSEAARSESCKGERVYIQIYDGSQRDSVRTYRERWQQIGASVPPIEDVTESARKNNLPPPRQVSQPTVRYHDKASIGCAYALLREVGYPNWLVEQLSPRLKPSNRTVEVWIPTSASLSAK